MKYAELAEEQFRWIGYSLEALNWLCLGGLIELELKDGDRVSGTLDFCISPYIKLTTFAKLPWIPIDGNRVKALRFKGTAKDATKNLLSFIAEVEENEIIPKVAYRLRAVAQAAGIDVSDDLNTVINIVIRLAEKNDKEED